MTSLEDLERRKKELELKRDIARLERNERIGNKASSFAAQATELASDVSDSVKTQKVKSKGWSWLWVAPLALLGAYLVLGGLVDGPITVALAGFVLLLPAIAKLFQN